MRARHAAAPQFRVSATNNATASDVAPAPESINMLRRSLQDSETRLRSALDVVDMDKQMAELGDLQQQSESSELWHHPANARAVVQVRYAVAPTVGYALQLACMFPPACSCAHARMRGKRHQRLLVTVCDSSKCVEYQLNCMWALQRLGSVKSEIETIQRLQSMLDDGLMALELLAEVGLAHSPALCLPSSSHLHVECNVWSRRGRRRTSRFCRRRLLLQRAFSLGWTNGRLCACSVGPAPTQAVSWQAPGTRMPSHTTAM